MTGEKKKRYQLSLPPLTKTIATYPILALTHYISWQCGLKQSPRLWYERLSTFLLEKLGLKRINADHSIFVTDAGLDGPVVSTFIDDIKIMAPKESGMIERVKAELASAFSMADMGPISFHLGLLDPTTISIWEVSM